MYEFNVNRIELNCHPKSQLFWEPRMAQDKEASGLIIECPNVHTVIISKHAPIYLILECIYLHQ